LRPTVFHGRPRHRNDIALSAITGNLDRTSRTQRPFDEALADYERQRNETVMPTYEFTDARSGLEPPTPQMQDLTGAMRNDQALTERFLGVFAGTVPVQNFLAAPIRGAA